MKKNTPEELKGALVEDDSGGTKWLSEQDPDLRDKVKQKIWETCIVKNINPVLNRMSPNTHLEQKADRPFIFADGLGICDVIIDSQIHSKPLGVLDSEICENVIKTYFNRFNDLHTRYPSIECISIFHNHRMEAGATIPHSHSQIFATHFVPVHIESEIQHARDYFDRVETGNCPFCDMITNERNIDERVIKENDRFIAITPFASGSPFEIWILPKNHNASFGKLNQMPATGIKENDIGKLADILTWVLGRLYICVDDPGYNFVISTQPLGASNEVAKYWHWHMRIETQRLDIPAGYEMASQVRVNKLLPENAAKFLCDNSLGNLFKQKAGNIFQRKPEDIENILSIIKREFDEGLNLNDGQKRILKTAANAFQFSEYYIRRKNQELTNEEETILNRATSWVNDP